MGKVRRTGDSQIDVYRIAADPIATDSHLGAMAYWGAATSVLAAVAPKTIRKKSRPSQPECDTYHDFKDHREDDGIADSQVSHDRSTEVSGEQNRADDTGARNDIQDGDDQFQHSDPQNQIGRYPELLEELGFAFLFGKFAAGTGADQEQADQNAQPKSDSLRHR
jgi:hypothetical protein